ncbi:hypothetical protein [Methanobacterium subterraneum]|jgi:hypothetical protein|uniref:Uncharacterized protein n=1 Tax=Methanobacterium subterraneum TaxID=59277 RepID=A0A7K4DPF7_9EURY|nr:hypothetical protein [Methanobacterium subterraneum]MBW4257811.1 hypothetical protein [Methanobacterium sp. YSL]NMO10228.1 hypothetical protein [Methanobacterium subterraneum]
MPVDKAMADAILDTYRNMYREISEKGVESESFKAMENALRRMEALAMETDDITDFTAKLTTENLFIQFSNAYSETMAALLRGEYSGDDGDEILLEKTLEAYENSIKNLEADPNYEILKAPIEELIELGRSGISYAVFLRTAEEKGLYQLLEGDLIVRDSIMRDRTFAEFMHLPLEVEKQDKLLKIHDKLVADSPFKVADSFQFGLERERLDWEYAPLITGWNITIRLWEKMLMNVYDWLDSFGSFAPHDERWVDLRGQTFTMRNIKRTQECNPGVLRAREVVLQDYFQLGWDDIFQHETYINEYQANRVWYSDETLELIKKAYPHCQPYQKPPEELVNQAETIYTQKRYKRPEAFQYSPEDKEKFISLFGEQKWDELFNR